MKLPKSRVLQNIKRLAVLFLINFVRFVLEVRLERESSLVQKKLEHVWPPLLQRQERKRLSYAWCWPGVH